MKSLSCVRLFATRGLKPSRVLRPWDSPGKNTGVGCHFLLQGIFPTQGLNPGKERGYCFTQAVTCGRIWYWTELVINTLCVKLLTCLSLAGHASGELPFPVSPSGKSCLGFCICRHGWRCYFLLFTGWADFRQVTSSLWTFTFLPGKGKRTFPHFHWKLVRFKQENYI